MTGKKIIQVVVVAAAAAAGAYIWREYHRKNADLADAKPDYVVNAIAFVQEYSDNDSTANKKYLGKIVSVEGPVKKIEHDQEGFYTVVLGDKEDLSSVRCLVDTGYSSDAARLPQFTFVKMKGVVTGFNKDELGLGSDILLNRCAILRKKN